MLRSARNFVIFAAAVAVLPSLAAPAGAYSGPAHTWNLTNDYQSPGKRLGMNLVYDASSSQLLLFGGEKTPGVDPDTVHGTAQGDTWTWDGQRWSRLQPPTSPPARWWAAAAYDPSTGQVVLFGGRGGSGLSLGDTWTWNGSTWTQAHPASSPSPRWGASMFYDPATDNLVLFGGRTPTGATGGFGPDLGDTWTWDGTTWSQQLPLVSPPPRSFAASADGAAGFPPVIFGGNREVGLNDTWTWDGVLGTWAPRAVGPALKNGASMAYDSKLGAAVLFGGAQLKLSSDQEPNSSETWLWDGHAWTQASPATSPMGRFQGALAYDPRAGAVILYGGSNTDSVFTQFLADTWAYDGSGWSEQDFSVPSPRAWPMAARGPGGQMVLFGGMDANAGYLGDTWIWSGAWQRLSGGDDSTPPPRYAGAMAYDEARGEILLFGGRDYGAVPGDTWLFSPDAGWQKSDAEGPVARWYLSLAYDPLREEVVLFGGTAGGLGGGDTWTWDGSGWEEKYPYPAPPGRLGAVMAFDPAIGKIVLFGGISKPNADVNGEPVVYGDTWTWDGTAWAELLPAHSPPPREQATMAYDPSSRTLVLHGGCAGPPGSPTCGTDTHSGMGDTWTFDGTDWTAQDQVTAPPARVGAAAVDGDGATGPLLFGGRGNYGGPGTGLWGDTFLRDTWTWGLSGDDT